MDTDKFDGAKVNYKTLRGSDSTAYLDRKIADNIYGGTNKHTDEPVVVYWIEDDQNYIEGFETEDELRAWIREELLRDWQKTQLEDVIGPMTYGARENYEVYQDADGDWQIRPSKDYIGAQVRGIFNTAENQKEE